ncbi:MAG TPA: hypothetical protein VKB96_15930 [Gammaproteobacteria bacterium]|nr:hypothetical protein [Gammaproteobacteria bacterium]
MANPALMLMKTPAMSRQPSTSRKRSRFNRKVIRVLVTWIDYGTAFAPPSITAYIALRQGIDRFESERRKDIRQDRKRNEQIPADVGVG